MPSCLMHSDSHLCLLMVPAIPVLISALLESLTAMQAVRELVLILLSA